MKEFLGTLVAMIIFLGTGNRTILGDESKFWGRNITIPTAYFEKEKSQEQVFMKMTF